MERIEHLREEALDGRFIREFFYRFYKAHGKTTEKMTYDSYATAYVEALRNLTPVISKHELIVGKIGCIMSEEEKREWEDTYEKIAQYYAGNSPGQDSHMAIDYELILSEGIVGICARIDQYLKVCKEEKKPFYHACQDCLSAVALHSEAYAREAELQMKDASGERKEELLEIARICRKVPLYPAESFREAIQSVNFFTYVVSLNPLRLNTQQFQLGHPDRYLLPYYERDRQSGQLTKEKAQLLLDCLGIQINNRVHNGLSSGYMVGGRDETGQIVENDLTEMCMQVIDDIRLVYPAVGLCYAKGMSDRCLRQACAILSRGRSHPAIFNDDLISEGLRYYGVSAAESHQYIHSTCVEITPVAASNVWVASPYTNLPQLLLDTMEREYESFDAHLAAFLERLDYSIQGNFEAQQGMRKVRAEHGMNPLLSTVVHDCLKSGTDIECGGARYNWIMPSFVGMANLVDSLFVLKTVVYDRKEMSVCEMKAILDANYLGHENLRRRFLDRISKYGNDDDEVDSYVLLISQHIVTECQKYEGIFQNSQLIPSVFCWIMHECFGKNTGATPDGRKACFPLGDGSGPCQGRERGGPTASILSSTKWSHKEFIGGVAVNMKFSHNSLGADSLTTMVTLIKTYLERGGFEMQINVVDRETLEKAKETPEAYRDLVVRIGGYSDYFVRLSPEMQEEVILRTEHKI